MRVEGPLAVCQLMETTFLNLTNFASLMATNAARFRLAAGPDVTLLEFGLRRAQGPDGAMHASKYSYIGGFDATSNVMAGFLYGIQPRGTHAHSFVSAFTGPESLATRELDERPGRDFVQLVSDKRDLLGCTSTSDSELASFIAYAQAFPDGFLALVDTYDTLTSGIPNFIAVAAALHDLGYRAVGIRLDSGDLAYLSKEARRMFRDADALFGDGLELAKCNIVASNNINEAVLHSLNDQVRTIDSGWMSTHYAMLLMAAHSRVCVYACCGGRDDVQGHEIDTLGVGTHLVTCQMQPALGMVYKLVQSNGVARIKISNEVAKVTIPCRKDVYRLIGRDSIPLLDLMMQADDVPPELGKRILCHHPFEEKKRVWVNPSTVISLLQPVWVGARSADFAKRSLEPALSPTASSSPDAASAAAASTTTPTAMMTAAATSGSGRTSSEASAALSASMSAPSSSGRIEGGRRGPDCTIDTDGPRRGAELGSRVRFPSASDVREYVRAQFTVMREDHIRPLNPTPYKVSVTASLFHFIHELWNREVPIVELG